MREAYRHNQLIINILSIKYNIIFLYLGKKTSNYSKLNENIFNILTQLSLK